jgi:REP element-mobilizing transposase RayT
MPDHLHWLLELGKAELCDVVGAVKSVVAHRMGRQIWQAGFFDRAVRRDEDLRAIARYVVGNPIRAGLAPDLASYSHWDAIWL